MAKVQDPQMLTANRLVDGDVLYWRDGSWVLALAEAEMFADPQAADAALVAAQRDVAGNRIVNPYLFDVRTGADGAPKPVKEREIIRAAGPTVRGEGKQADHVQI